MFDEKGDDYQMQKWEFTRVFFQTTYLVYVYYLFAEDTNFWCRRPKKSRIDHYKVFEEDVRGMISTTKLILQINYGL